MSGIHEKDKQLYAIPDLLNWKPPQYTRIIDKGILNTKNKMIIFGDEGSWKSILALHTAHCISRGSSWLGFRTYPSIILRLQSELPMYIDRERMEKYCNASKRIFVAKATNPSHPNLDAMVTQYAYPTNCISRTEQFIHIDESIGWESLKRNIELCAAEFPNSTIVVILDPLYKIFGRNISEETDVKPLLDRIDLSMEDTKNIPGISFIIVHHTRKAKTDESGVPIRLDNEDATGARTWVRWADTVLRIDPFLNDQTMTRYTATFTKHRNADDVLPVIALQWNRETLHPRILWRKIPKYEDEGELDARGDTELSQLE